MNETRTHALLNQLHGEIGGATRFEPTEEEKGELIARELIERCDDGGYNLTSNGIMAMLTLDDKAKSGTLA